MRGLSLVAASGGHSSSWCVGLSLSRPLLLRSTGSRCASSVIAAHGPTCSACGILPDQGSNPCPVHRQADSQPLRHRGSPLRVTLAVVPDPLLWSLGPFPHVSSLILVSLVLAFSLTSGISFSLRFCVCVCACARTDKFKFLKLLTLLHCFLDFV